MRKCKTYWVVFFSAFFVLLTEIRAQDTLNSIAVEQTSYRLYTEKKWDSLETFVKKAMDKGFDYYYLRMRIGIAYYEQGDYIKAQKQFEKARAFDSYDDVVLEYLYYCFIYSEQYEQAVWLSKSFSKSLAKKLRTNDPPSIGYVLIESGVKKSDSSNLYKPGYYFHVGLGHYVAKRISLFHAGTYFEQAWFAGHGRQYQYYLRANIPLKKNWEISPAAQYMGRTFTPNIQPVVIINPPPGAPPPKGPPPPATSSFNYITGSIAVKKTIPSADFTIGTTVSSIFNATQYIHSLGVNYYPEKDHQVILGCVSYMHTENNYVSNNWAFNPYAIVKPFKPLTLSLSYLTNKKTNIIESNGYIINNSVDLTSSRWSFLASVALSKQVDLYGLYQYENKVADHIGYTYHYHLIVFGLKIKPK